MSTTSHDGFGLRDLGVVSTVIDAALAFLRGDRWGGAVLLAAAALSRKLPGLGVVVSLGLRVLRRLRSR